MTGTVSDNLGNTYSRLNDVGEIGEWSCNLVESRKKRGTILIQFSFIYLTPNHNKK